jgi:DNA-binding response OmpR family regulator
MTQKDAILVVDDNAQLLSAVQRILEIEGYTVFTATDGAMALAALAELRPNLIIADIAMPHINGYQLHARVRQNPDWALIPFIFLTGRALDSDIRYGKEMGVDDYLIKPIEPEDLLVAVRGKLKRARQWAHPHVRPEPLQKSPQDMLVVGALSLDVNERRAKLNEEPISLSTREFILLENLARRPGEVVPPEVLLKATHGFATNASEAGTFIRPLIRSLRRKLGYPSGELGCIETVRGWGYRLQPPPL